jgi:hypothetical protein
LLVLHHHHAGPHQLLAPHRGVAVRYRLHLPSSTISNR